MTDRRVQHALASLLPASTAVMPPHRGPSSPRKPIVVPGRLYLCSWNRLFPSRTTTRPTSGLSAKPFSPFPQGRGSYLHPKKLLRHILDLCRPVHIPTCKISTVFYVLESIEPAEPAK